MFTETVTVIAVGASQPLGGPTMTTPATPMILVTVRNASGNAFTFQDVEANAELYYFGAVLTHTIVPIAVTPASTSTTPATSTAS